MDYTRDRIVQGVFRYWRRNECRCPVCDTAAFRRGHDFAYTTTCDWCKLKVHPTCCAPIADKTICFDCYEID